MDLGNALRGYIAQLAPAHPHVDRESVCEAVINLARSAEFDVLESVDDLLTSWDASHQRYLALVGSTYLQMDWMREPTTMGRSKKRLMLQECEVQPAGEQWNALFQYINRRRKRK